jgi:hypothetical protein
MENQTIVIARYNEDIRWCLPFIEQVVVYNKGNDDLDYIPQERIIKCENLGREGGTYVKHIIDNYDKLSNFTIFLQGKSHDHMDYYNESNGQSKLIDAIKEKNIHKFRYIGTLFVGVPPEHVEEPGHGLVALNSMFPAEYLKDIFNHHKNYTYGSGALFVSHKDQILKHPKEFWIELYSHLQEINPAAGFGLEKLWRFLLEDGYF